MIIEDFEREATKDSMFLLEKQLEMEEEWQRWEEEHNRKPAKIRMILSTTKPKKNERNSQIL